MNSEEKASYLKIVEELRTISRRLGELSEAGFSDMEGTDGPEFFISEELWGLDDYASKVFTAADQIANYLGK